MSSAMVLPFKTPSVVPITDKKEDAFMEVDHIIASGELSSAIGWGIGCSTHLTDLKRDMLDVPKGEGGFHCGRVVDQVREYMIVTSVTMPAGHCV